jgi:hypothetical protein
METETPEAPEIEELPDDPDTEAPEPEELPEEPEPFPAETPDAPMPGQLGADGSGEAPADTSTAQ